VCVCTGVRSGLVVSGDRCVQVCMCTCVQVCVCTGVRSGLVVSGDRCVQVCRCVYAQVYRCVCVCTGVRSGLVVSGDRCVQVCRCVCAQVYRCVCAQVSGLGWLSLVTGVYRCAGVYVHRCQVWAGCLW